MKYLTGFLMVAFVALALSAPNKAEAGDVLLQEVNIALHVKSAYGTMQGARYSADSDQFIYCITNSYGTGSCYAKNKAGTYKSCYTNDPEAVAVIRSMTAYSYFTFKWDDSGKCSYISANNGSKFIY